METLHTLSITGHVLTLPQVLIHVIVHVFNQRSFTKSQLTRLWLESENFQDSCLPPRSPQREALSLLLSREKTVDQSPMYSDARTLGASCRQTSIQRAPPRVRQSTTCTTIGSTARKGKAGVQILVSSPPLRRLVICPCGPGLFSDPFHYLLVLVTVFHVEHFHPFP